MEKYVAALNALLVMLLAYPVGAVAQSLLPDPVNNLPLASGMNTGGGWTQIYNWVELRSFIVDAIVTLALASAIALHPVRRAARSTTLDFVMPKLFAFYALIGMVVGFLVDQHGYIIGFVIFGIGALLRFRSNLDDPIATVEMILVTVLGLCVGLDLPVMAILIGFVSWALIWVAGRRIPIELRLQADSAQKLQAGVERVQQIAEKNGWTEAFLHRSHSKNAARIILLHKATVSEEGIETVLLDGLDTQEIIWKLGN